MNKFLDGLLAAVSLFIDGVIFCVVSSATDPMPFDTRKSIMLALAVGAGVLTLISFTRAARWNEHDKITNAFGHVVALRFHYPFKRYLWAFLTVLFFWLAGFYGFMYATYYHGQTGEAPAAQGERPSPAD